ncbi:MAG: PQQ-binding-like beta-propeller repeat protein [Planctomycetia bacterium]|nr:PQQ-binding-like beta-propeller repeat protein [Planctomycetia bacterium]
MFVLVKTPGHRVMTILAALLSLIAAVDCRAGDWPQILGPNRNGVAASEKLVDSLPAAGPALVWEHDVGEGFSGVAVADGRLVVFHRVGDNEIAEGLDAVSGKPLWEKKFPATFSGGYSSDHGPRCVPLIDHGAVYLFGARGELHCLDVRTGAKRWSRPVGREFEAPDGFFGVGSTPLVEGDKLLVNVGGRKGSGVVAFALSDGKTVWQATDEKASYSSPIAVTVDGVRHVIVVTRLSALSIDPEQGRVRWQFRYGDPGPTVNAATPQVIDGHLFLSASYGIGADCRRIGKTAADPVWADNDTMSSQFSTSVPSQGFLFGVHGRQDSSEGGRLRCFDPKTGKVKWSNDRFPIANLIVADEKLVIVTDNGQLILAAASSEEYRELARAKLSKTTTRALPALANGLLYVRDDTKLKCFDLRRTK